MLEKQPSLKKLLPPIQDEAEKPLTSHRYRYFRRTLVLIMLAVTLAPLIITATLSFYQYGNLIQNETRNHIRWNAQSTQKTISFFLNEIVAALSYYASEYSYEQLADPLILGSILARLKSKNPGLVDLSLVDHNGIQKTYAGPYNLTGSDYFISDWFSQAVSHDTFISQAFLGYRQVPHFVITITKGSPNRSVYGLLKASIDSETLDKFISTTKTEASDDIFLIDYSGNLQTSSRFYGKAVSQSFPLTDLPNRGDVTLEIFKGKTGSEPELRAYAYIENTPWILVLVKKGYTYGKSWSVFKKQMQAIVTTSVVLVLVVVMRVANVLVGRIRQGDEAREAILAEVEHTSKLASVGRLAAGVAHEINNPLAIIDQKAGLMEDLMERSDDFRYKAKFAEQIAGVQNAVSRCKVITHRLLGFARRMDVTPEPVMVNELIREVLAFLEKEILYRNIRLELELHDNLPTIQSDRGQLQQIFLNIINNAIDAIEDEGFVKISTSRHEKDVRVDIADNGCGIPPETLKHIFEPFYTTKTKGEHKGTGLGLSITYGLVKRLGGTIRVDSTVGQGTTFTVLLPIG
ncbi:MAG: sensor histidine kinase [Desulfobulbaceae bacterium]